MSPPKATYSGKQANPAKSATSQFWRNCPPPLLLSLVFWIVSLSAVGIAIFYARMIPTPNSTANLVFPIVALFGVGFLLFALTLMSVAFKQLGVGDPRQALGLPEGSVRAIIAMSLIVIFIIFVVILYYDTANPPPMTAIWGLSRESFEALVSSGNVTYGYPYRSGDETLYRVFLPPAPKSEASQQIARDVITLVGTLMTAVAAFYFGAKTGDAKEVREPVELEIVSPSQKESKLGPDRKPMTVKLRVAPKGEGVTWNTPPEGDDEGVVVQKEPGVFEYRPSDQVASRKVYLRFGLVNYPDVNRELTVELEPQDRALESGKTGGSEAETEVSDADQTGLPAVMDTGEEPKKNGAR
jgi:hypothetical protein